SRTRQSTRPPESRSGDSSFARYPYPRPGRSSGPLSGRLAVPGEKLGMHRHDLDAARDDLANAPNQLVQLPLGDQVDGGMIIAWQDVLPEHHLHPARDGEHLLGIAEEAPAVAEQADVVGQLRRNLHAAAVLPEWRVAPLGREVMQDQKVADALALERRLLVVTLDKHRTEAAVRHQVDEPRDTGLDHVDAGRLEWLHETARESHRHAVAIPELPAHAGGKPEFPRLGQRTPVEIAHQDVRYRVVLDV